MRTQGLPPGRLIWIGVIGPVVLALAAMVADLFVTPHGLCFDVAWTAAALSATIGSTAARFRAQPENRVRWTLWALAAGAWLFGQIAWDVYGIVGFPTSPNLADAGWWLFALLVMASMLRPPRGPQAVRVVTATEQVPLLFAAVSLCLGELWGDAAHSHLALAPKLSDLAYPVLYVSATVLTLQALVSGTLRGGRSPALRLMLVGISAQAVGFIFWSSELLAGTYNPGQTLLDPVWVIGLAAMGIGGLLAARNPEPVVELVEPRISGVVLPGVTFLALTAALGVQRLTGAPTAAAAVTLRVGVLCSGAALIARSTVLARRLQNLLERERAARVRLAERESELARLNEQLLEDSRRDPLTGIGNRRALSDDMPMFASLREDGGQQIAVLLCDVDHFKAYNDRLGHLAGDQALRMIASTARGALRQVDSAYRFGGEELLLVLREAELAEAVRVAERVRAAVHRSALPHPGAEAGVLTVSIGVACGDAELGELLARADRALYEAKRSGRDRVVAADHRTHELPHRPRSADSESPMPRHLRSMLSVSRAAAARQGAIPVAETLAEAITSELSFQVVVVNLLEESGDELRVAVVAGDAEAHNTLHDRTVPLSEWQRMLDAGEPVHGAAWLPVGSIEFEDDVTMWTPSSVPSPAPDAWHPDDMLLLPLRGSSGELLGIVSVDQPLLGRRPSHDEIGVLMAVADHAGLALEQVQREGMRAQTGSDELRLAAVLLLAETLDLRDPSTALHSRTVGRMAAMTAEALGLRSDRVERIQAAGVLHDLGKLGIADAILHKPDPLSEAEWREMQRHPEIGARILEHAGMLDIAGWVRWHHERLDGLGYPDCLPAERIPLESRILAVADAYEAMIADRPYRKGMPAEDARQELLRYAGTQFDPRVVNAFLSALTEATGEEQPPDSLAGPGAPAPDAPPLALRAAG